jgi:hypothetical protein
MPTIIALAPSTVARQFPSSRTNVMIRPCFERTFDGGVGEAVLLLFFDLMTVRSAVAPLT